MHTALPHNLLITLILFIFFGLPLEKLTAEAASLGKKVNQHEWANIISDADDCVRFGCQSRDAARVCTTQGCVKAAARLLNSIDEAADPCENFYQYACGQFATNHPIPDDKSAFDVFDELTERVRDDLKRLLENDKLSLQTETHRKTVNAYKACMNTKEIQKRGVQPGLDLLKSTNIWPVIQPKLYDENSYDVLRAIANLAKMGNDALIAISVDSDAKNPTQHVIIINQAMLGMPSEEYFLRSKNDTTVRAYYQYMLSVAAILDAQKPITSDRTSHGRVASGLIASRVRIESQLPDVLDFEIALANIVSPKELTRDPVRTYNKMTIAELQQRVPQFHWLRFVNTWLEESEVRVTQYENVIVYEPEYLMRLFELLKRTPLMTVANYLGWRTIQDYIFELDDSLQEARLRFLTALEGISEYPPRYISCIRHVTEGNPAGVARLYVDNEFDKESKALASSLISSIRAGFGELLSKADWLGKSERKKSLEKLAAIFELIAYDDDLLDNAWLDNDQKLNVGNASDYFGNAVRNNVANVVQYQNRLRKTVNRDDFDAQPADVNAFYSPTTNAIKFLAGFMQLPFFDRNQPMSLNFGGIGYVMGHEITHGFDDEGRQYDKNGLLDNWWKNATVQNFLNRSQCVVNFYNDYTVDEIGLNLNGQFTLGENLADLGGLNAAYIAHQNWLKEAGGSEPFLPGLPHFSNEQLFFLGAAAGWCTTDRPEALKQQIFTDPHSPDRFRVNGPMSNMPEFSKAFDCPLASKMNPQNKCRVW